jgi:hypothetical protein
MDQDSWCGQYGGGFSYNPAADPPQVLIDYKDGTPPFPVSTRPDLMIAVAKVLLKHGYGFLNSDLRNPYPCVRRLK